MAREINVRNFVRSVFSVITILFLATELFAQKATIFAGPAFPQGDFKKTSGDNSGDAENGFGAGIEFYLPTSTPTTQFVMSVSFISNSVDVSPLDQQFSALTGYPVHADVENWLNVPLMAGLRLHSLAKDKLQTYGQAMVGINIARIPSVSASLPIYDDYGNRYTLDLHEDQANSTSFAFGAGAGVVINKNINLGVRYLNCTQPKFDLTATTSVAGQSTTSKSSTKGGISMFLITGGYSF